MGAAGRIDQDVLRAVEGDPGRKPDRASTKVDKAQPISFRIGRNELDRRTYRTGLADALPDPETVARRKTVGRRYKQFVIDFLARNQRRVAVKLRRRSPRPIGRKARQMRRQKPDGLRRGCMSHRKTLLDIHLGRRAGTALMQRSIEALRNNDCLYGLLSQVPIEYANGVRQRWTAAASLFPE